MRMRNINNEGDNKEKEDENDRPSITTRGGRLGDVRIMMAMRAMRARKKWRMRRMRRMSVTTKRRGLQRPAVAVIIT